MKGKWKLGVILLCSGGVLFAALGMLTSHLLRMERENAHSEIQRAYEDELRLAMWQLDSAGMRLLLSGGDGVTRETFSIQQSDNSFLNEGSISQRLNETLNGSNNRKVQELTKNTLSKSEKSVAWSNEKGDSRKKSKDSNRKSLKQIQEAKVFNNAGYSYSQAYRDDTGRAQREARIEALDQNIGVVPAIQDSLEDKEGSNIAAPEADLYRPTWVDGDLYLTRANEDGTINGRWMDVEKLKAALLSSVIPTLTGASLISVDIVNDADPLTMVTWPLRLEATPVKPPQIQGMTPLRSALALGWVAALAAITAVLGLLYGLWKLSERRAAFVSSVTHELRTPLTTFQLYSDMMAEGMVPEDKKVTYLQTMRSEAGRLGRLVENVLSYAQIERGSAKQGREALTAGSLVDRILPHLEERVHPVGG